MSLCRVLVSDPPWLAKDSLPGPKRGAADHYPCMPTHEIMRFPLPPLAKNSVLFLWRVSWAPADALDVCSAWGFEPKSEMVWRKMLPDNARMRIGLGRYVRMTHETCIIATRGAAAGLRKAANIPSVFDAPVGRHSEKPDAFYRIVERLFAGPYVELFARRPRDGWTTYGNELEQAHP